MSKNQIAFVLVLPFIFLTTKSVTQSTVLHATFKVVNIDHALFYGAL